MKRTYIQPTIEVILIQTSQMLASSPVGGSVYSGTADADEYGLSREFDYDDDEWED